MTTFWDSVYMLCIYDVAWNTRYGILQLHRLQVEVAAFSMTVFPIKQDAAPWFMEEIIQFSHETGYGWF